MKYRYLLFIILNTSLGFTQNAKITIGRGTNCFGRGACTIQTKPVNNSDETMNAEIISADGSSVLLRVFRNKLTPDEDRRILGEPISQENKAYLSFVMDDELVFDVKLQEELLERFGKQIDRLSARTYATKVSEEFIDITLVEY